MRSALLALALLAARPCPAKTVVIDIAKEFGVTPGGIKLAVAAAERALATDATSEVELYLGPGVHSVNETGDLFVLDKITPKHPGRLVIRGAGMDATTLVTSGLGVTVFSRASSHVSVRDLTFSRSSRTVTQGVVRSCSADRAVLEISPGFPSPLSIYDASSGQGRYVRAYTDSATDPRLVVDPANNGTVWPPTRNAQAAWDDPREVSPGVWSLSLRGRFEPWQAGALLAVKSKHQQNAYFFDGGDDVAFQRVQWLRHSRGVVRGGISNVLFDGCVVERGSPVLGRAPALATPGGGPQIGQPGDPAVHNVTVSNHSSVGTGDDSIALFHVAQGAVRDSRVSDSFARGILLYDSPSVELSGNDVRRCPVFRTTTG